MKSVTSRINGQRLPQLPEKFWLKFKRVMDCWKRMNILLEHEWTALKNRDVKDVVKIAKVKTALAEKTSEAERSLAETVDLLVNRFAIPSYKDRWAVLRIILHENDLNRLNEWKRDRDFSKNRAFDVNKRLHRWIDEQVKITSSLTLLLSGRKKEKSVTYSNGLVNKKRDEKEKLKNSFYTNNALTKNSQDDIRSGISAYKGLQQAARGDQRNP